MANDTSDRILNCAQALMVERGYNAFSYADIAETVAVSKATIHFHFPTKAVLAEQVVRRYREGAMANLSHLSGQMSDAVGRLEAYANYWEGCIRDNKPLCMCALLAAEILTLPAEVGAEVRAFFRGLEEWLATTLEDGTSQGSISLNRSPVLEAKSLFSVVYGAMLAARVFGDAAAFGAVTADAISSFKVESPAS